MNFSTIRRWTIVGTIACLAIACGDAPAEEDGGPGMPDGASEDASMMSCEDDGDCDDGVDCTVGTCTDAMCEFTADDAMCDDGNPCTADACDAATGCEATDVADGTTCSTDGGDDGLCIGGTCFEGCTADADCDDDLACTGNTCDTDTGVCNPLTFDDAACDDGNPCTVDACDEDGCANPPAAEGTTCTNTAGSDGTCTSDGVCVTGCTTDTECDDSIPCTNDTCDTSIGACTNVPDDTACDDGVACTNDVCSAATGCSAEPDNSACNDGISCTVDTCDTTAGCLETPMDTRCDDSVSCTVDVCSPTSDCGSTPDSSMCDDGNPCTADSCDATGGCGNTMVADGTGCMTGGSNGLCDAGSCVVECTSAGDCDDGDACNGAETCDTSTGTCAAGTALTCNDSVACTDDSCDPSSGCVNATNDGNCNDGNPCTTGTCTTTGCSQADISDGTSCTVGGGTGVCASGVCDIECTTDGDCDDGVACTTDTCSSNTCSNTTNDAACDDSVACTTDTCTLAGCSNATDDAACDDSNPCTANTCTSAGCGTTNVMDGVPCTDGGGDAGLCLTGSCNVECTSDADCDDGSVCTGTETCSASGQCQSGTALVCNDGVACTTDGCDPSSGCTVTPDDGMCDDSTACTTDTCGGSGCMFTPDSSGCDDSNECTADLCMSGSGCTSMPVTNGTSCMGGAGTCQMGTCTTTNPRTYRLNTLVLEDPHVIADHRSFPTFCQDITNNDATVFFQTITNLNTTLDDLVNTDGDGDMLADLSFALHFPDLDRSSGATGTARVVESDCSLPDPSMCSPTAGGQDEVAPYTIRRTGSCTPATVTANVDTMMWPDGEIASANIHRPTAGANGCFITDPLSLSLTFEIEGTPVTIPLTDVQVAGTFANSSETAISNGVLIGFLSEAEADMIDISVSIVTLNLGQDLLPEAGQCEGHDGRDMNGVSGWWFMLNLTGAGTASATGY